MQIAFHKNALIGPTKILNDILCEVFFWIENKYMIKKESYQNNDRSKF